ncbi:MAG: ribosomal protein S18-alanine N-acetyltransferase [Ilumatobacteraceae bacterium]
MSMLGRLLPRRASAALMVEPLRRRHLAGVMEIEQVSYPKPWTLSVFQSELGLAATGERVYLVAREGSHVVGYAGMMVALDEAHVTNIAVAPAARRGGLGNRLLAELAWAAIGRGCTGLTLEVRVSNTAAQALYGAFGFEAAGVRRRYYENTEDAIVMWRHGILEADFRQLLRERSPEAGR